MVNDKVWRTGMGIFEGYLKDLGFEDDSVIYKNLCWAFVESAHNVCIDYLEEFHKNVTKTHLGVLR